MRDLWTMLRSSADLKVGIQTFKKIFLIFKKNILGFYKLKYNKKDLYLKKKKRPYSISNSVWMSEWINSRWSDEVTAL